MYKLKVYVVMSVIVMLGACASPPLQNFFKFNGSESQSVLKGSPRTNEAILAYISSISSMSVDAQKKELSELNQMLQTNKQSVVVRMELALLYSIPSSHVRDTGKAQVLLDELLKDKSLDNNDYRTLAILCRDYLSEALKLTQKARDEQRRADNLQIKADSAQQRADALQQKLDELKVIEKTMQDRGQGSRK